MYLLGTFEGFFLLRNLVVCELDFYGTDNSFLGVKVSVVVGGGPVLCLKVRKNGNKFFHSLLLQLFPELRVRSYFLEVIALAHGFYVKAAASAENREDVLIAESFIDYLKVFLVAEKVVFLSGLGNVYQVIGNLSVLGDVFAGSDVHSAIDLPGVRADDVTSAIRNLPRLA